MENRNRIRLIKNEKTDTGIDRYVGIIISSLSLMISTIISDAIPSPFWRLAFIICYMISISLFLIHFGQAGKKKIFPCAWGIAAVFILIISSFGNDITFGDYMTHVLNFFSPANKDQEIYAMYYQKTEEINNSLKELSEEINAYELYGPELERLNTSIEALSGNIDIYRFWESKKDQKEVDQILQKIQSEREKWDHEPFPDLTTDKEQVELFYKMWLSPEPYCYYNIIEAMEAMGIDCQKFQINEYTLALWDTEHLFAFYNMRKDLEHDLEEDVFHDEWIGFFDTYKVSNMGEYNDTFYYYNWRMPYTDQNTSSIMSSLDDVIMNHYKKFVKNFRKTSN